MLPLAWQLVPYAPAALAPCQANQQGLFPLTPQVVAVRGLNPTGQVFIAQQLVSHLPAPAASTGMEEGAAKASVVVAAGPYTTSDDLAYEPLEELLQYCAGNCRVLHDLWYT